MADKYQISESVKLYPSALRGGTDNVEHAGIYNPESKIGTEANLINAINALTLNGSFVLARDNDGTTKFFIHGYYFEVNLNDSFCAEIGSSDIYASIRLTRLAQGSYQLWSLTSYDALSTILDDNSDGLYRFKGLLFSSEKKSDLNSYSLHLLTKKDGAWIIPDESKLKFDLSAISNNGDPLSKVLSKDTLNIPNINTTNLTINEASSDTLNSNTINSDNIVGSKGSILDGVAEKAQVITNENGETITVGDKVTPVALQNGEFTKLNNVGDSNTIVYVSNGTLKTGMKIWASDSAPLDSQGNNGDFWFQYQK